MSKLSPAECEEALKSLPRWTFHPAQEAITQTYAFGDFSQAFAFMVQVALAAQEHQHHPRWTNDYNRVTVEWTTHDVQGLSVKDIRMAQLCDAFATTPVPSGQPSEVGA